MFVPFRMIVNVLRTTDAFFVSDSIDIFFLWEIVVININVAVTVLSIRTFMSIER